ncbi:NADPH-dependent F420 reductase [Rhizosphaericola mali]|uniref:Dinucleotide-binding enzyme n=1 Tax=Rhizosphaericola mali TaxID=2545455 RepID=A0A5P2G972_9BACT|nr:NAD(P)-binding domain-containing protein [Rhizosphaericola mali]QES90859.1 dinucleotide-binding enzyme [Rhizosphaericola mali]
MKSINLFRQKILSFLAVAHIFIMLTLVSCAQQPKESKIGTSVKSLKIGIIGSGNVGGTLGKKWSKAGYKVFFSSRHPEELKDLVTSAGPNAQAGTIENAIKFADVVVLAVPYKAEAELSNKYKSFIGDKILIDCDNAYSFRDGAVVADAKSEGVANYTQRNYFPKAKLIRAFNAVNASSVASADANNKIAIPFATDDPKLKSVAEELIIAADGIPKDGGSIKDSKSFDL